LLEKQTLTALPVYINHLYLQAAVGHCLNNYYTDVSRVTRNDALDYWTHGLYRTPNLRPSAR